MDQETTKSTDKRNWRERLGIGVNGANGKELPRISDDYKKDSKPAVATAPRAPAAPSRANPKATAVKPAPMAPRSAAKTAPAAPSTDKLAERLRAQREAQAKLAEQRIQSAKGKSEPVNEAVPSKPASTPAAPVSKPRFVFAEEETTPTKSAQTRPPAIAPARPALGAQSTPTRAPGLQPPRPQPVAPPPVQPITNYGLGAPAPAAPTYQAPNIPPAYVPPAYQPQPQAYAPPPINYPPQPQAYTPPPYVQPSPGFRQNPGFQQQPGRMSQGLRPGLNPNLAPPTDMPAAAPQGFSVDPRQAGRQARAPLRAPAPGPVFDPPLGEEEFDDATVRAPRRPAADYRQAYNEAEIGFEEEAPRSRVPWILIGFLGLLLLAAAGGIWYYTKALKPMMNPASSTEQSNVVQPPPEAPKVVPEAAPDAGIQASKKLIYDRIVGDQEVLGGAVAPSPEQPVAPEAGQTIPQPEDSNLNLNAVPSGEDTAPLPIPPPPGNDQQGSLPDEPAASEKTASEVITPAASESQAAVAPPAPGESLETSETAQTTAAASSATEPAVAAVSEPEPEPVVKPAKKKAAKPKLAAKPQEKSLGSKPVVLVPPAKKAVAKKNTATQQVDQSNLEVDTQLASTSGGLYGDEDITIDVPAPTTTAPPVAAPKKKKKTLADLFNGTSDEISTPETASLTDVTDVPQKKVTQKPAAPAAQQVASTGGYVAQLSTHASRNEATAAFAKLKSKHGSAFSGVSAIVTEKQVAGTTRYSLSAGGLSTRAAADAFCAKLFAAGERDCLVKRQ